MDFLKRNWRAILASVIIIALSWVESERFSEATGVDSGARKVVHLIFLFAIQLTGYVYWLRGSVPWMKSFWTLVYAAVFVILVGIGGLQWKLQLFTTDFLDQIRILRTFFSSPLPFIGSIVLGEIYSRHTVLNKGLNAIK